jgi:sugar transferase (PEP-CTERM system associated)
MRIFKHNIHVASFRLALFELILLFVAVVLTNSYLKTGYPEVAQHPLLLHFVPPLTTFVFSYSLGLYGKEAIADPLRGFIRHGLASLLTALAIFFVLGAFFYVRSKTGGSDFPLPVQFRIVVLYVGTAFLLTTLGRYVFLKVVDLDVLRRRILVLGTGQKAERIQSFMQKAENLVFARITFLPVVDEPMLTEPASTLPPFATHNKPLAALVEDMGIDELVVATDDRRGLPIAELLDAKLSGIAISDYLDFYEREARRIDLDALSPSWFIYSDGFASGAFHYAAKRSFDILVSAAVLAFALPVMLMTAILIRLDSPGPIFYRQVRTGQNGKPFTLFKFRSMRVDAERDGPQWAALSDNRITRVGAFIRKTRIDELPQVFCVLRGQMSFIGPRPERPFFVESLMQHVPYYNERHRMKPGITGWAQVNYPYGASIADAKEKLSYDLYYTKNFSLFLDILILLQTIRVVLVPEGAR